jgi:hypothetical protein
MPLIPESLLGTSHLLLVAPPCPQRTGVRSCSLTALECAAPLQETYSAPQYKGTRCTPRTGQRSKNPSLLPNTTVLFYGRILATGVSVVESSYVDYVENDVIAGFVSSADADSYAIIPIDHEGIVFNLFDDPISGSHARIPGLFTMIGGPACGPDALVSIIQHYNWSKVVLYFQNARNVVILSEAFVSIALLGGIEFDLQKRESAGAGAAEADLNDLQAAKSNIFVFFGGLLAL